MKKQFLTRILSAAVAAVVMISGIHVTQTPVEAAETATLRIFSTADLHGESITTSYDSNSMHKNGSLAQLSTVIKEETAAMKGKGGTMLVDSGDTLYGYLTENMANGNIDKKEEYMFKLMKAMGYDAMALGNHDFDYGLDYVKQRITASGLDDTVVMSNVYDGQRKEPIFLENKVVEKELVTSSGSKVKVKVGVIGVVITALTTYYDWTDEIEMHSILGSVGEHVNKLKAKGVDAIIVLAHCGIGKNQDESVINEEGASFTENYGYEISRIPGVNAVMCGHTHEQFPKKNSPYESLGGYDENTKLFNGKVIVEERDRGQDLGITDLTFNVSGGKLTLASESVRLREIKSSDAQDPKIVNLNKEYDSALSSYLDEVVFNSDKFVHDYFAFFQDNPFIQAINEAKIQYGLSYVRTYKGEFKDFPVIACTDILDAVGANSGDDYLFTDKNITIGDIIKMQYYSQANTKIFYLSGKELRNWLELQASSLYQKADLDAAKAASWKDETVRNYVYDDKMIPVLNPEWIDDWSSFHVFDGIEYDIDVTVPEKYSKDLKEKNPTSVRIKNLTCNGKEVKSGDYFVLVCSAKTEAKCKYAVEGGLTDQVILSKTGKRDFDLFRDYLLEMKENGDTHLDTDDNFRLLYPQGENYLIKTAGDSKTYATSEPWYRDTLITQNKYTYYRAALGGSYKDTSGPLLVVADTSKGRTKDSILVAVQASDRSGIKELKYLEGMHAADAIAWGNGTNITGTGFKTGKNGVFTVRAVDKAGNATVKSIKIENFDPNVIDKPTIKALNNRKSAITGTGIPGASVTIEVPGNTYHATVDASGNYKTDITPLRAGDTVNVYQTDKSGGKSETVSTTVVRKGANVPTFNEVTNKDTYISGTLNDSPEYCLPVAVIDKVGYVPGELGKFYFENSTLFSGEEGTTVICDYEINGEEFKLYVPDLNAGRTVKLASLDWVYRSSISSKQQIKDVAPNRPTLKDVYCEEGMLYGSIPDYDGRQVNVSVTNDAYGFTASSVDSEGNFSVDVKGLRSGDAVHVSVSDTYNGVTRHSAERTAKVGTLSIFEGQDSNFTFGEVTTKSTEINGKAAGYANETLNLLVDNERIPVNVDASGSFHVELTSPLAKGTRLSMIVRSRAGNVNSVGTTTVKQALPDKPTLGNSEDITDLTKTIKIWSNEEATAVVKVGNIYYKTRHGEYDDLRDEYLYVLKIDRVKAGRTIGIYMENDTGASPMVRVKVKKKAVEAEQAGASAA